MKYTLDTNIYINAFRDPRERSELARFEFAYTPMLYLTSIVAHELRAGARTPTAAARLTKNILAPFKGRRRIVTPSYDDWRSAGAVRANLAARGGTTVTASFLSDIMLAVTCRTHGFILITRNTADFAVIKGVLPQFQFETPYP